MEVNRTERILFLGVVPLLAAGFGAVATVVAQRHFGDAGPPSDAVMAVLKMPGMTVSDRIKLLAAVTQDSERFYSFLHLLLGALGVPIGFILVRFGQR